MSYRDRHFQMRDALLDPYRYGYRRFIGRSLPRAVVYPKKWSQP